ncbi:GxxExxY protein [Sphingorhabdus sp. IMCC26285]|uniref:GxxExxY protein n=1 Tax=Sphingorhabdus profundilacus TaxID=2509718 RepID=A0A6I4LUL2_9SPHN|nr:GxxExxY protein [Sphingorhabdus profundilacus]MVZ96701.1 GxxExxY protein [Sphingorhabdus profundilacus]
MLKKSQEDHLAAVIDAGYHLHKEIGPGLLESVYETVLAARLKRQGLKVVRQMPVDVRIDGLDFANADRVDLFVNDWLVLELKALEKLLGVHIRQTQTYVKLLNQPMGLVINFGSEMYRHGVRRVYSSR